MRNNLWGIIFFVLSMQFISFSAIPLNATELSIPKIQGEAGKA